MTNSPVPPIKAAELVILPRIGEQPGRPQEHDVRTVLHALPHGKGHVFGLLSIEHKEELTRERFAHILESHLEHLAADLADDVNPARRFEQALARINRDLGKAAKQAALPLHRFRAVIGIVVRGQIFLSGFGELQAIFLHKTADRRFVIYELDQQFEDKEEHTWDKPFTAVLDGELHTSDALYIATRVAHHVIGLQELQDILVTLPPAGALERIQQFLPTTETYGGLIFRAAEEEVISGVIKSNPIGSLNELANTHARTANVLGDNQPDLAASLKHGVEQLRKKLASPGTRGGGAVAKKILSFVVQGLSAVAGIVLAVAKKLGQAIHQLWVNRRTRSAMMHGVGRRRGRQERMAGDRWRPSRRSLAGLGIMVVVLLIGGLIMRGGPGKQKSDDAYTNDVSSIEGYILAAEASLIYKNNEEAQRNLDNAIAALELLPRDSAEQVAEAERIAEELETLSAKIHGITLLTPTVVGDLRKTDATANLLAVSNTTNGIQAISDSLGVYKLDTSSGSWIKLDVTSGPLSRVTHAVGAGDSLLALDTTEQLARVNLTTKTLSPIASGTNGMASVDDIFIYNDSLYALTSMDQQIVKMRPQAEAFEGGTPWISARASDLSTARAIAIDADVYVLLANKIIKYTSGREATWAPAVLNPPLSNPLDLWTSFESKYLYVLDPSEMRVVVIEKASGSIVAQFVADKFAQAVGFVVEEGTKKITVVTTTEALEFTPQFLVQ